MKRSRCNITTRSRNPMSSKSTCGANRTPSLDYSPNPSFDEHERKWREFADRLWVSACESGYASRDSDPIQQADFLKEVNEEHGFSIPIDMDDIKAKLSVFDERIKKMSSLSKKTNEESPSTFGGSPQTSDNMVVVEDEANKDVPENKDKPGVVIIIRTLKATDIDDYQCRLSLPCKQVKYINDFLTRDEVLKLSKRGGVPAKVIDSYNRVYHTNLRKVKAGPKNYSYVIGKPWNRIKRDNGFKEGMKIEVRVFRRDGEDLCFTFERVEPRNMDSLNSNEGSAQ